MKLQETASSLGLWKGIVPVLALAAGCQQEPPECQIGRSEFQAQYILVAGTGPCAALPGEVFGAHTYYEQGSDGYSDYDKPASLAIQSDTIGFALSNNARDPDELHRPYALGKFSKARPDGNDLCRVPALDDAVQATPEFTAGDPAVTYPATTRVYQWEDLRVLVSPAYAGSQWQATLTYTENGCTATYDVRAVMSVMECETDADCYAARSTINPDFDVICDGALQACVPAGPVPSLK